MQVMESKKKQAVKVNKMRKKKANAEELKDPLEIGDICTISTDDLKKKYFPYLPVVITGIVKGHHTNKYSVAARHGYIKGYFDRQDLKYREQLNTEIVHIDTEVDGIKEKLSLPGLLNLFKTNYCYHSFINHSWCHHHSISHLEVYT